MFAPFGGTRPATDNQETDVTAHTSTLLAAIELTDAFRNRSRLMLRRGDNAELVIQLGSESIGSILKTGRDLPPAFCHDDGDMKTVNMVLDWIKDHTNRTIVRAERGPSARVAEPDTRQAHADTDTLLVAVREMVSSARAIEQELNDPHGDGSGRDSKAPDADTYNELLAEVALLFPFVPAV